MKSSFNLIFATILAIVLYETSANAQGFAGFRAGKEIGVNGVFYNPASMSTTKDKFSVNAIGFQGSAYLKGSYDSVNVQKTINTKFNELPNWSQTFLGSGSIEADILGPSISYKINNNQSVALTTRHRFLANGKNVGGTLNYNENDSMFSFASNAQQNINYNAWRETGISYSHTLINNDLFKFTTGVSAKFLKGSVNFYLQASPSNVAGFAGQNGYLNNTNGTIKMGGAHIDDCDEDDNEIANDKANGFGMDIGFMLEKKSISGNKPYDFRIGASLLDVGAINYKTSADNHGAYAVHIAGNNKFYTKQLENKTDAEAKNILAANSQYFTALAPMANNYSVSLPTNLNLTIDYAFSKKLFVEASTRINLLEDTKIYESSLSNYIAITPRLELNKYTFYTPVSYNELAGWNAGINVKRGVLYGGFSTSINQEKDKFGLSMQAGLQFNFDRFCNKTCKKARN